MPHASKASVVAEYAKSNRSACKACSKAISAKSLRLGVITKDPRGFNSTKWHHITCYSDSIESTDVIEGFNLLQTCDQEALKNLVVKNSVKEVNETLVVEQKSDDENRSLKKTKVSTAIGEVALEISFSLSGVSDKFMDAVLLPNWKAFKTVIYLEPDDGSCCSAKIAAFDFDGCLANTNVKRIGADAWSLMYPSIPEKLKRFHADGYKLVIFTNESNIGRWKNKRQVAVDSKIGRLNSFIKCLNLPIQVFIACGYTVGKAEDPFRKPNPGMWNMMEKHFNSGIPADMDKSFYVGDAAGRPGDHSDSDIKFAQAIGLKFYVPEDLFLSESA